MCVPDPGRVLPQREWVGSPFRAIAFLLLAVFGGGIVARSETGSVTARPSRIRSRRAEAGLPLSQIELGSPAHNLLFDRVTPRECLYLLAMAAVVGTANVYRNRNARLKERERELTAAVERSTTEALAAQQANQAKDRFLAVLSHELRTPLTPVLLSVGSLLDEEDVAPEIREHLEMIRRNIELETQLLNDLFDTARIQRGLFRLKFNRLNLHEVISRAREICFTTIFEAGLEVFEDFAAEDHHIQGDSTRLMQLFWNLIRNAARFAQPGSSLKIRTVNADCGLAASACEPGTTNSDVSGRSAGSEPAARLLVVEFQDTGIGIAPELLERIFDPFVQAGEELPKRESGLGLGLAIGRQVAEAHGGRLTAFSPGPGQGATFRLELMTAPEPE
jgi:signal transduction histidine kinase